MWWIVLPAALLAAAAVLLFLVYPARPSRAQRAMLERRTYAHRGLYTADQRVPENSLPAFRAAVEAGFGLCERTLQMLRAYDGPYCVESFDPFIVRWFRRNAPDVVRGQLSEQMRHSRPALGLWKSLLLSRTCSNFATRPHFIAYRVGVRPWPVRLANALGALYVVWTARPDNGEQRAWERACDAIIFEHYRPPVRY